MHRSPGDLGYLEADLTMQTTAEGGRQTAIRTGYRPNWWLLLSTGRTNAGGTLDLVGAEELAPGASGRVRIYPFIPELWRGVTAGTRLEMSEGPMLVGRAVVTRVVRATSLARGG